MAASDFRINSSVRSLLARRWVDLRKVQVSSFRGTVRLTGEINKLGCEGVAPSEPQYMDQIELDIQALPEVERAYFEITNWRRNESGHWICLNGPAMTSLKHPVVTSPETTSALVFESFGKSKAATAASTASAPGTTRGTKNDATQGATR